MIDIKIKKMDALEKMAQDYIVGELPRQKIIGLNIIDRLYVLNLAAAFSCTRIGTMSREACAQFKFKAGLEYRAFATSMFFNDWQHKTWIENVHAYSGKKCELNKELLKDKPDAVRFISLLVEMLGLLTREDVLLQMFLERIENPDFKKQCQEEVRAHGNEWLEKFGYKDESYMQLIEDFFKATDALALYNLYADIGIDALRKSAGKNIPVKADNTEAIVKNMKEIYDSKRKRGE